MHCNGMYGCENREMDETNPHCLECLEREKADLLTRMGETDMRSKEFIGLLDRMGFVHEKLDFGHKEGLYEKCNGCPDWGLSECAGCTL